MDAAAIDGYDVAGMPTLAASARYPRSFDSRELRLDARPVPGRALRGPGYLGRR